MVFGYGGGISGAKRLRRAKTPANQRVCGFSLRKRFLEASAASIRRLFLCVLCVLCGNISSAGEDVIMFASLTPTGLHPWLAYIFALAAGALFQILFFLV